MKTDLNLINSDGGYINILITKFLQTRYAVSFAGLKKTLKTFIKSSLVGTIQQY